MSEPKFLDKLRVTHLDGPLWKLTHRMRYYSGILGEEICVPNGFVTDFASVPRLPVAYMVWGSRADRASVVHDYLYRFTNFRRIDCDYAYLEAMKVDGYSWWTRWPMFLGVRIGGWMAYGQHEGKLNPR